MQAVFEVHMSTHILKNALKKMKPYIIGNKYTLQIVKSINDKIGSKIIFKSCNESNVLVQMDIMAQYFKSFTCNEPQVKITFDPQKLRQLLKQVNDNAIINILMHTNDQSCIYIKPIQDLSLNELTYTQDLSSIIKCDLIDDKSPLLKLHSLTFDNKVTLDSHRVLESFEFITKYTNYMKIILLPNNEITFASIDSKTFENHGIAITLKDIIHGTDLGQDNSIDHGIFDIKPLMKLVRCENISDISDISFYLKPNCSLGVSANVSEIGKIIMLVPQIKNNDDNK